MKTKNKKASAFLAGISSTTDLLGVEFLDSSNRFLSRTDLQALQSDWVAVGEDIAKAMERHVEERPSRDPASG